MKRGILILLLMGILLVNLISAQIDTSNINPETGLPKEVEKVQEFGEEFEDLSLEKVMDWAESWKDWFLGFKIVSVVDSFFQRISIVFVVLFGQEYEFSLSLLLVVVLWTVFFIYLSRILELYSALSSGVSYIIGLAVSVVVAQVGVFGKISESIIWAVFYLIRMLVFKENITWTERLIIIGVYAIGIFVVVAMLLAFGRWWKKVREERKLAKQKSEIEVASKVAEGITKSLR